MAGQTARTTSIGTKARAATWVTGALRAALASPTCTPHARSPRDPSARAEAAAKGPSTPGRTVILVPIDGVRWQDVFEGVDPALADRSGVPRKKRVDAAHLVPNLYRLMTEDGAAPGAPGSSPSRRRAPTSSLSLDTGRC